MRRLGATIALLGLLAAGACDNSDDSADDQSSGGQPSETNSPGSSPSPTVDPNKPTGWGPTEGELAEAHSAVAELSLRELAGQVIVAAYAGTGSPTRLVERYHLGGVIVMTDNVASTEDAANAMRTLQDETGRDWPLWLSVDQEGGIVERLGEPMTQFPAYMTAGAGRSAHATEAAAKAAGGELVDAGFTVVYAPDADVTAGPSDPTIGSRSAGGSSGLVSKTVLASLEGYDRSGIIPVVKHFPGHGSVPADSHEVLPVQEASLAELKHRDLRPFAAAIKAEAPVVMISHIAVKRVDRGVPSSLSHRVVTGLLRHQMGFDGVAVTDALNMGAIVNTYGAGGAAVKALLAGDDVLLMPASVPTAIDAIVSAVHDGRLPRKRLEQAATRMVALLLHQEAADPEGRPLGSSTKQSLALSRAGITVVDGPCQGPMVDGAVRPTGDSDAVAAFTDAAEAAGVSVGSGTVVDFVGYAEGPGAGDIVVSTDTPYVLGDSDATMARIALYGDTPEAMRALVEVLTGDRAAPGRLPVAVDGVLRDGC
ncbi:MAG TPA: glycoside hydrolase family 3 N-terminal domain-containing protein [Nocardioidaceae bacterium]|nr:glycoside hydrolase family 3 N-terminal domain-containing protein [Nocardioidaceae bacterium]